MPEKTSTTETTDHTTAEKPQNAPQGTEDTATDAEPTTGPDEPQEPVQDGEDTPTDDGDEHDDDHDESPRAARQAAKYRRELRATQAELEETRAQLAQARRHVVEHLAGDELMTPGSLWLIDDNPSRFFGDDGTVDKALVDATVHGLSTAFRSKRARQTPIPTQGTGGHQPAGTAWLDAFKGNTY